MYLSESMFLMRNQINIDKNNVNNGESANINKTNNLINFDSILKNSVMKE